MHIQGQSMHVSSAVLIALGSTSLKTPNKNVLKPPLHNIMPTSNKLTIKQNFINAFFDNTFKVLHTKLPAKKI